MVIPKRKLFGAILKGELLKKAHPYILKVLRFVSFRFSYISLPAPLTVPLRVAKLAYSLTNLPLSSLVVILSSHPSGAW
jgi:hypothetical protein